MGIDLNLHISSKSCLHNMPYHYLLYTLISTFQIINKGYCYKSSSLLGIYKLNIMLGMFGIIESQDLPTAHLRIYLHKVFEKLKQNKVQSIVQHKVWQLLAYNRLLYLGRQ